MGIVAAVVYRPPRRPQLVAHRGYSGRAPANTVAATRAAVEVGVDMVEVDVCMTSDGHAVAIHGPRLEENTSGRGRVKRTALADVRLVHTILDGALVEGEGVPLLSEVTAAAPDMAFNFDLKTDAAIDPVLSLVDSEGLTDRCVISGSTARRVRKVLRRHRDVGVLVDLTHLDKLIARVPRLRAWWLVHRYRRLLSNPLVLALNIEHGWVDAALVDGFARHGIPVWTFTVDDQAEADRLVALGVESITSNHPGNIRLP